MAQMSRVTKASGIIPKPAVLGARLRAERMRLGLTTEEVGRLIGSHSSRIVQNEAGCNPTLSTLLEYVRLAGYSLPLILPELFVPTGPIVVPPKPPKRIADHVLREKAAKGRGEA